MLKPIFVQRTEPSEIETAMDGLTLALDILEYLASETGSKEISEIARQVKGGDLQVFGVLKTLVRLGYVVQDKSRGTYTTTPRLYELGINAPFMQDLLERAGPFMQALSEELRQSCNLAVPFGRHLTVVLQTEGPGAFSINVPIGFRYDSPTSAPVLACYNQSQTPVKTDGPLDGAVDLSCPVFDGGSVTAVLTIPYLRTTDARPIEQCLQALQRAAIKLSSGQAISISRLYG